MNYVLPVITSDIESSVSKKNLSPQIVEQKNPKKQQKGKTMQYGERNPSQVLAWDRHKNVAELNNLTGYQPSTW